MLGAADLDGLMSRLGTADTVWRVDFVFVGADDRIARRAETSSADLAAVIARLTRLDRNGPWTGNTLRLIDRHPGIVSTTLARRLSRRGEAALRALG